jgi:hypothetical protein
MPVRRCVPQSAGMAATDALVFAEDERGPGDDLRLQFEAATQLDDEGKALVKALLEAVLLRQEARRWAAAG